MQVMWDKLHKNHKLDEDAMRMLENSKKFVWNSILCNIIIVYKGASNLIKLNDLQYLKPQANWEQNILKLDIVSESHIIDHLIMDGRTKMFEKETWNIKQSTHWKSNFNRQINIVTQERFIIFASAVQAFCAIFAHRLQLRNLYLLDIY